MDDAVKDFPQPVHFVGIGGAGMSGIAAVLARWACASPAPTSRRRATRGIWRRRRQRGIGHAPATWAPPPLVVMSTAIPESNPEVQGARRRAARAAAGGDAGPGDGLRRGIAVAGTHGKTTTSSMIAHVLYQCGMDPTFLVGGELNDMGSNAGVGQGEWLVAEADESDGSLLFLRPELAVVTNVELDHHANYRCLDEVHDVFRRFVAPVAARGPPGARRGSRR